MKKTAFIAACLFGLSLSTAAATTYTPLTDNTGWTEGCHQNSQMTLTYNTDAGTLGYTVSDSSKWSRTYAHKVLTSSISLNKGDTMSFSFSIAHNNADQCFTLAFVDDSKTLAVGYAKYDQEATSYTFTDTVSSRTFYSKDTSGVTWADLTASQAGRSHNFTGTLFWNNDTLMMTLTDGHMPSATTVSLGDVNSLEFKKLIFTGDSDNLRDTNVGSFSNLSITVTPAATQAIPEPATATLSLLALAGLAARRRRK